MIVAGCDVGSTTGKAVILTNGTIGSYEIIDCLPNPVETAQMVMDKAVKKAGISADQIEYTVGTGYGRMQIPFADKNISEITCHGVGAFWVDPEVRTIIDIGGQDCKVIGLNDQGKVVDFVMNDKCAAGTGRFFEAMARVLNLSLEKLSTISLEAHEVITLTNQCSVFTESEVITKLNEGKRVPDIAAGIQAAIAGRLLVLIKRVGEKPAITVAGGCAKNVGLVKAVEEKLGKEIKILSVEPQIIGALGAAVLAKEVHEQAQ
ncbi:MAG: acyl-CoA dehydratase activase [Thermodesulfobacteriota bacterium]|nr:acyl-CoA dehydratase activase [Thermodesulfobacteriota bacterium]